MIFALLFFCLMALGALVIDLGLARLTQRQMQTAVDSAALEGLRGRNRVDSDYPDPQRRADASQVVAWTFDDDFDLRSDQLRLGAGPRFMLTGGIVIGTDFTAGKTITLLDDGPPVYDPVLSTNSDNHPAGDMVAGNFNEAALRQSPADSREAVDYSRLDFTPATAGAPADQSDAFLVRLRRTDEFAENGGTTGGRIPYLFAHAALRNPDQGLAVRATAIAQSRMAMSIGRRTPEAPATVPGALPFVIERARWITVINGSQNPLKIVGNQVQAWDGQTSDYVRVGFVYDFDATDGLGQAFSLGETAPVSSGSGTIDASSIFDNAAQRSPDSVGPRFGYIAIVGPVNSSPTNHVVALGAMEITRATATDLHYSILRRFVGSSNASSVLARSLDAAVFADQADDPELEDLLIQRTLSDAPDSPLLSPGLVR